VNDVDNTFIIISHNHTQNFSPSKFVSRYHGSGFDTNFGDIGAKKAHSYSFKKIPMY